MTIARPQPPKLLPPKLLRIALALAAAAPAAAQEVVQPLPGTTQADALADDMRRLATNPRDVDALVDAARLSLSLDDVNAAAALLQRAENVAPGDPRVKAGQASVLLRSERPGQALRYFAQAEAGGLDPRTFAADRGLAYDLTGRQELAQRDYARALRDKPDDDETIRRYALSLGISGQRQRALALLDPLVRRSDRGAWRAQAFVLAMSGDVGGASRIAATMMPGGAAGLSAFFERLPALPAVDRAFAVHFGEVRATPERLADARLAPPVGAGGRDAPVALASVQPLPSRPTAPSAATAPVYAAAATRPVQPVAASPVQATPAAGATRAWSGPLLTEARETGSTRVGASDPVATTTPPVQVAAAPVASPPPAAPAAAPSRVGPSVGAVVPQPVSPRPVQVAALPPASLPRATVRTRAGDDSILARIVANLSIPAAELGVEQPARAAAEPAAPPTPGRSVPSAQAKAEPGPAEKAAADRLAAAKLAADKRAADRKAAADRKVLAEKKAAAEKKALADREAAEKRKLARANPERIWVQVAGGAFEGDLPKAYAGVKAKAPAVFGSRAGWTTPLRATNRVLTGPFKTDADARAFVNDLRKQGVSAFTFTSDAGQPVTKLGAK